MSTPVNVLRVDTIAGIGDQAKINIGNEATSSNSQDVHVAAGNDYSQMALAGALGLSGQGAVAPAGNITSAKLNTSASIGENAEVAAKKDVSVFANATEDALFVTAAGSAGSGLGVSGSLTLFSLDNSTHAAIESSADVSARGNIIVEATDDTDLDAVSGAVAFSGGPGVGL